MWVDHRCLIHIGVRCGLVVGGKSIVDESVHQRCLADETGAHKGYSNCL